jgi:TonB family protein
MTRLARIVAAGAAAACLWSPTAAAQAPDTLAAARELYGSAAYDEALGVLERVKPTVRSGSPEARDVEEYRALCLLALGRQPEAERAIEALVAVDPGFRPDESAVSPRVLAAFDQVRRRLVPVVAQQRYGAAKAAYDRKEYAAALEGFEATLRLIDAPGLGSAASEPPLSDLRTIATGFRDLARAAAEPPPAPAPVAPEPQPVAPPPPPAQPVVYSGADAGVTPPTVVNQVVPQWPSGTTPPASRWGLLEVRISETGAVESTRVVKSINSFYDEMLLTAAKRWRFKPATKDGAPVKFRWVMRISLGPE